MCGSPKSTDRPVKVEESLPELGRKDLGRLVSSQGPVPDICVLAIMGPWPFMLGNRRCVALHPSSRWLKR